MGTTELQLNFSALLKVCFIQGPLLLGTEMSISRAVKSKVEAPFQEVITLVFQFEETVRFFGTLPMQFP